MNPSTYIPIVVLWIIVLMMLRTQRKTVIFRRIIKKRRTGGNAEMKELATRFIGKECIISSFDGHQYEGIVREVTDGAILAEKKGKLEAINLDFILRIREYPKDKNGKKKSVVLD